MPTSTVDETREHDSTIDRPSAPAAPSHAPYQQPELWSPAPEPRVLRRKRRSKSRRAIRWALRLLAAAAVACALLVLFEGEAEAQVPGITPLPIPVETPTKTEDERPESIDDWIEQLKRKKLQREAKTGGKSEPSDTPSTEKKPVDPDPSTPPENTPPVVPPTPRADAPAEGSARIPETRPASGKPGQPQPPQERVRPTVTPAPRTNPSGASDAPVPTLDFASKVVPIGAIPNEDLPWTETLDLILSLEKEFSDFPPVADLTTLRTELYGHLVTLSVTVGHDDNPRVNLDELRAYVSRVMGLQATQRERANLERLLPRSVLPARRGSPTAVGLIVLLFADLVSKTLELEPILVGDTLGLRYRSGAHRYTVIPTALDRLYSDREFLNFATGKPTTDPNAIRILTRREFWGVVMAEAGDGLLQEGHTARAHRLLDRSIDLFQDQALPHIALARIHVSQNDLDTAREALNLAVKLDPTNASARFERASILKTMGDADTLEKDLRWLAHEAKNPLVSARLIQHYLDRSLFRDAEREFRALASRDLPPSMRAEVKRLKLEVGAAPWVARLRGSVDDADRFEAIDALTRFPTRATMAALIDTIEDRNLRLGTYALKCLREMTKMDLDKDANAWRAALDRLPSRS
ncbi:MAG: tetratricopeptide repeat protein [Planctomycetota bacterium]